MNAANLPSALIGEVGDRSAVLALALALASYVPPRNSAARMRRHVRAMVFTPALMPSLVVFRRRAWPGGTGPRSLLRIGVGVTGAGGGDRIGLDGRA
jgi:hypothetical protein